MVTSPWTEVVVVVVKSDQILDITGRQTSGISCQIFYQKTVKYDFKNSVLINRRDRISIN